MGNKNRPVDWPLDPSLKPTVPDPAPKKEIKPDWPHPAPSGPKPQPTNRPKTK
jgi:hypothetical protein